MTETEVNNLKNMCKTDPHLKGFVTEVTDEKQGTSNQFRVTIATKKGARWYFIRGASFSSGASA